MSEESVETVGEALERPKSRRALLQAAGVAAGAVAASKLLSPDSAAAADGGNMIIGQANTATSKTSLTTSGAVANDGALSVTGANADYGLYGSGKTYGVTGVGPGGVLGLGTVGGVFSGSIVAINLDPQLTAGSPTGQAFRGDMTVDSTGVLWLCVAAGTPGTWIKASHGGTRLLASPQRAYSSTDVAPFTKMNQGETRTIPIAGVVPGVPSNALGVVLNITIQQTVSGGFVTAWPAGSAKPATSTINWSTTGQVIANGATIGIGTAGAISLFADAAVAAGTPATHVIVDVTAYVL